MSEETKAPVEGEEEEDAQEVVLADGEKDGDEEVADPLERITELESQVKSERERLLRTAAELDNLRKRSRREIDEATQRGRLDAIRGILPVIDSLDIAVRSADPDGPADAVLKGVEMVRKQFLTSTEQFGLKPIEGVGRPFDPNFHEAVAQIPTDKAEPGEVIEEMRKGYMLRDMLLRPAMVVVARAIEDDDEPEQDEASSGEEPTDREDEHKAAKEPEIDTSDNEPTDEPTSTGQADGDDDDEGKGDEPASTGQADSDDGDEGKGDEPASTGQADGDDGDEGKGDEPASTGQADGDEGKGDEPASTGQADGDEGKGDVEGEDTDG